MCIGIILVIINITFSNIVIRVIKFVVAMATIVIQCSGLQVIWLRALCRWNSRLHHRITLLFRAVAALGLARPQTLSPKTQNPKLKNPKSPEP